MIEQNERRTKVIKSFEGKALTAEECARATTEEVDILRLVYTPDEAKGLKEFLQAVPKARPLNRPLAVMLDLASYCQGLVSLKEDRELKHGEKVVLAKAEGGGAIVVRSKFWDRLFVKEAKCFLGSGQIALRVLSVGDGKAELEVVQGGTVHSEAELFVPATRDDPSRRQVPLDEVAPLLALGVDHLLIPGQCSADNIRVLREKLVKTRGDDAPWLLLKVDTEEVYHRLDESLDDVDGVLISRRELAQSLNPATVPMITKEIIQLCNDRAKIVVTASEMLASMRRNVTPTRAEVSDIANAVIDGTDAVVISEEVANGKYGPQAVVVTHRIIRDIEDSTRIKPNWTRQTPTVASEMDAISYHAYRTAERIKAKAIVCITKGGNTALKLASFRPPIPIIAVTFTPSVVRRLAIVHGVESLHLDVDPKIDDVLPIVNDHLVRGSWLRAGDPIIFVSVTLSSVGRESSNLFTVQRLT